jgi:hypothetical protein
MTKITVKTMTLISKEDIEVTKDYLSGKKNSTRKLTHSILMCDGKDVYFSKNKNSLQEVYQLKSIFQYFLNVYWRKKTSKGRIDDRYQMKTSLPGLETDLHFSIYDHHGVDPMLELAYKNKSDELFTKVYFEILEVMLIDSFLGKIANGYPLDPSPDVDTSKY